MSIITECVTIDVETFTMAKDPENPIRNEDRFVIVPDRAYAVIDGVSDKTKIQVQGKAGGQLAGQMVEEVIQQVCESDNFKKIEAGWLSARFEERFKKVHKEISQLQISKVPPKIRLGAQLALVIRFQSFFRFIIIGDAGIRINGQEVFISHQPLDGIYASIRQEVWHYLDTKTVSNAEKNEIARAYTVNGLGSVLQKWSGLIDERILQHLRETTFNNVRQHIRDIEGSILKEATLGGLLGQHRYINRIHPLGYPCINGFSVPLEYILQFDRRVEDVDTIELFSDGYFGHPGGTKISDWEERFSQIEATDPEKIGEYLSTKGSLNGCFADDRTVMILRCNRTN